MEGLINSYSKNKFNWSKQDIPNLPCFNNINMIIKILKIIKSDLYKLLIQYGINVFEREFNQGLLIKNNKELFLIALITKRYGAIYFISRYEVDYIRNKIFPSTIKMQTVAQIEFYLNLAIVNRIFNIAIYSFLLHKSQYLRFSSYQIPKYCFSPVSEKEIYVNESDFKNLNLEKLYKSNKSLYDLHDFSHYACVMLNSELYGCRLYSSFIMMPKNLKKLIFCNDLDNESINDNFVFRTLSQSFYEVISKKTKIQSEKVLFISKKIFDFFQGNKTEYVNRNGNSVKCKVEKLNIKELIVLSQNKACEHTASEMEEQLMIRGGLPVDKDPLFNINVKRFVETVNKNYGLFYFEERNIIRHRSHKYSYKLYCNYLLNKNILNNKDLELIKAVKNNLDFIDFYQGHRTNLNNLIINNYHIEYEN